MTRPRHSARRTGQERTCQSDSVRSPHTAHSFMSDLELFQGVIPSGDLAARLRDLLTTVLDEQSPALVAAALETRLQHLLSCSLSRSLVLQVPFRLDCRTC